MLLINNHWSCTAQENIDWNLDFEHWIDSLALGPIDLTEPNGYRVENSFQGVLNNWGKYGGLSVRTTDATSGNYALVLYDWYGVNADYCVLGKNGSPSINLKCKDCGVPITFKPEFFSGDYKLDLLLGDSIRGEIYIYLTQFDIINRKRDTVGFAKHFVYETTEYKSFEFPIEYKDGFSDTPDSLILLFGMHAFGTSYKPEVCKYCEYFYLDNLKFSPKVSTSETINSKPIGFRISSNPETGLTSIENLLASEQIFFLYDFSGRLFTSIAVKPFYTVVLDSLFSGHWIARSSLTKRSINFFHF